MYDRKNLCLIEIRYSFLAVQRFVFHVNISEVLLLQGFQKLETHSVTDGFEQMLMHLLTLLSKYFNYE